MVYVSPERVRSKTQTPAPPDKYPRGAEDANSRDTNFAPTNDAVWMASFLAFERECLAPDGCLDPQGVFVITPNSTAVAPC